MNTTERYNLLLDKVLGLIQYAARRYCWNGHPTLDYECLLSCGYEALWVCVTAYGEYEDDRLLKLFKSTLFNSIYAEVKLQLAQRRRVDCVSIDAQFEEYGASLAQETTESVLDEIQGEHTLSLVRQNCSDLSAQVLDALLDPPAELLALVKREFDGRNDRADKGGVRYGTRSLHLQSKHVCKFFGLTYFQYKSILDEVKVCCDRMGLCETSH